MRLSASMCIAAVLLATISPAHAHQFRFSAPLTGADAAVPNGSPGFGSAIVTLDEDEITMRVQVSFSDLVGMVTSANLFAVTADRLAGTGIAVIGDATTEPPTSSLPDFPVGELAGEYDRTINLQLESVYDPTFVATYGGPNQQFQVGTALIALIDALNDGKAYLNISTTSYPGGEIRGFPVYVPGDFNNNGVVDAADYVVWRSTLGQTGEGLDADFDNSNSIDEIDYEMGWKANFGRDRFTIGAGGGAGAVVPEPGTMSLTLTFGFILSVRRRRSI